MENEKLFQITVYTENQVGLLSSIAGIFTRRSLNMEQLMVYPSKVQGVHKVKITTRTSEERIKEVALQIEKKVDVIKAYYYEDMEYSARELEAVRRFLEEREKENNK